MYSDLMQTMASVKNKRQKLNTNNKNEAKIPSQSHREEKTLVSVLVFSFLVYGVPLYLHSTEEVVLDEMYLLRNNDDVDGKSSLSQLFQNDYWGRPLENESSHKSWRPVSVLILRFIDQSIFGRLRPVLAQRLFTVFLHTYTSYQIGCLTRKLFHRGLLFSTLIFALHPVHVEVVANAANRPHLLALFCSLFCILECEKNNKQFWLLGTVWILGLLSCETMVFQLPAAILTTGLLEFKKQQRQSIGKKRQSLALLRKTIHEVLSPAALWSALTFSYLAIRYFGGMMTIPTGLLEPAESPFIHLKGMERFLSFAYVVSIHIGKSIGLDWIGFAHEYSPPCITSIKTLTDPRLIGTFVFVVVVCSVSQTLVLQYFDAKERNDQNSRKVTDNGKDLLPILHWIISLAWISTLFPIAGILRVGTFVADRMVLASTVPISIYGGLAMSSLCSTVHHQQMQETKNDKRLLIGTLFTLFLLAFWAPCVWKRTGDWTSHERLFEQTRRTCPNSAKNLLQLSKIHSNNNDWNLALELVQQSHEADPNFCRVHYQFARIYLHFQQYPDPAESHLAQAVAACPTTSSHAAPLWKQYWEAYSVDDTSAHRRRERLLQEYAA